MQLTGQHLRIFFFFFAFFSLSIARPSNAGNFLNRSSSIKYQSWFHDLVFRALRMSLALFTICLISRMYGVEAANGQCKPVERSVSGKALKGHTFKELVVRAPFECQNICENDPRCASYNYFIPGRVCELNSKTKEAKPDDFVTDEQRFYMKREGMINCHLQFFHYLKGKSQC